MPKFIRLIGRVTKHPRYIDPEKVVFIEVCDGTAPADDKDEHIPGIYIVHDGRETFLAEYSNYNATELRSVDLWLEPIPEMQPGKTN